MTAPELPQPSPPVPQTSKITRFVHRIRTDLEWELRGADRRCAVIFIAAAVILLVFKRFGTPHFFTRTFVHGTELGAHPYKAVLADFWWFASCFVLLGVTPYLIQRFFEKDPGEPTGVGLGDPKLGLKWVGVLYLVMLPFLIGVSRSPAFYEYYPLNSRLARASVDFLSGKGPDDWLVWFIAFELMYALYFVGWEYFYRGFMTFGLHRSLGFNGVLAANVPFALMHAGKPFAEGMGSVVAGIALGLFALRVRSFWYCWLLHALIAFTMDLLAIQARYAAAHGG